MPIDVRTPQTPGWWMLRLSRKLADRQQRLTLLASYLDGNPPLPTGAENAKPAFQAFQKKARTNFAELIVEAVRERMTPTGLRTAVDDDETGDADAWGWWVTAGMDEKVADVLESMLGLGDGYMITGLDAGGQLLITAEDPRQIVTEHDPLDQRKIIAALKMFHDDVAGLDFAYLYLPGEVHVASRRRRGRLGTAVVFSPTQWDWDDERTADLPAGFEDLMCVVRFRNKKGVSEFEHHIDILERINHTILQRMVITTMQAFRQRAIRGDLPTVYPADHPRAGEEIDYDGIFVADPGALWMMPGSVEIWESEQADIRPILGAVKDDILHLAAVTRTPMPMVNPDSANQTAEGASAAKEGLVFKAEDRIMRAGGRLVDVAYNAFRLSNNNDRAVREKLSVIWAPAERRSLAEKADAASKATSDLPVRARLIEIWQLPPSVADRYVKELRDEQEQDPIVRASRTLTGG